MAPRSNQAAWEKQATDLAAEPSRLAELGVVSVVALSERTAMSVASIEDTLFRRPVTEDGNVRTHVCRPAYRVASTPYWSPEQARAAEDAARSARERTGRGPVLPMTTDGRDKALSISDIAAVTGNHEQTVRRWVSGQYASQDAGAFPAPTGRRRPSRRPGNPQTVFPRAESLAWTVRAGFLGADVDDAEVDARIDAAEARRDGERAKLAATAAGLAQREPAAS